MQVKKKNLGQISRSHTAWSLKESIIVRLWECLWFLLLRWTPKKLNWLRLFSLKAFGAKIYGKPFIFPSARIYAPFNLEVHNHACIGPLVNVYNLGKVVLRKNSVVSQETMLCGGTHDLSSPILPLLVGDIELGEEVFVGARALILPGISIGAGGVVGAGSVVTKDVEPWAVVGGNPAKFLKRRELKNE